MTLMEESATRTGLALAHKQANARVVRLEDDLSEAMGQDWTTAPPRNHDRVARLYAALHEAVEARSRTQMALFPGLAQSQSVVPPSSA